MNTDHPHRLLAVERRSDAAFEFGGALLRVANRGFEFARAFLKSLHRGFERPNRAEGCVRNLGGVIVLAAHHQVGVADEADTDEEVEARKFSHTHIVTAAAFELLGPADDQFTGDASVGDDFAVEFNRRDHFHRKSKLKAQSFEHLHVAGLAVAEAEIGADEDVLDVQLIDQDFEDKFFGGKAGEGVVEMEEHGGVEAGLLETGETLLEGGEHGRGFFGAEKLERMRVESDGAGDAAGIDVLIFVVHDGAENFLMAEVQAIEIADGERKGLLV